MVSPMQETEAAWVDSEYAAAASLKAASMTQVTNATCSITPGLTFTGLTISWKSVYDMSSIADPTYSPLSGTNSAGVRTYLDRANITQSAPVAGLYTYTAVLNVGLLGGLLGALLGATGTLTIQERLPTPGSVWVTPPKEFTLTVSALGGLLGSSCTSK